MTSPLSPATLEALRARARMPGAPRIEPVELDGRRYWIKRRETLALRRRLQKGDPARLFDREKALLKSLHARGVPVPAILDEGPGYVVLPDSGENLETLARDPAHPDRTRAYAAAGAALARLHRMGLSHGRPHPRDLCWNGEAITFLDPERGARLQARTRDFARDLFTFVYIFLSILPRGEDDPALAAFARAYRAGAPEGAEQATRDWCRRWRFLVALNRPLRWHERRYRRQRLYKRYSALPPTFRHFGASA